MDATVQSELLQQLPDVEPAFLATNRDALLASLGAIPGVDAVRAAVVRHLPELVPARGDRDKWLQKAAAALRAYPDGVATGDPLGMMSRHPAWVGLCHLEVAEGLGGDPADALEVAVQHARLGFSAAARSDVGAGEVLWAMAEAAEETGWSARADALMDHALAAEFVDEVALDQVRLLVGTRKAEAEPSVARALLVPVVDGDAPHPVRVQAAFVLARIDEIGGDVPEAIAWLERAVEAADPVDDAHVVQVLAGELVRLRAVPPR